MKKKIFMGVMIVVALVTTIYNTSSPKADLSSVQLSNLEALCRDETGTTNTGPAEEKKCYGGGHRMVCLCVNGQPCTGTDCY